MTALTSKQKEVLLDAYRNNGDWFQTANSSKQHSPVTLAALVKKGLLMRHKVGTVWSLTEAGRTALQSVY